MKCSSTLEIIRESVVKVGRLLCMQLRVIQSSDRSKEGCTRLGEFARFRSTLKKLINKFNQSVKLLLVLFYIHDNYLISTKYSLDNAEWKKFTLHK